MKTHWWDSPLSAYYFPLHAAVASIYERAFTSEKAGGRGVGRALIQFIATFALEHGCSRLDWTAEASNPKAGEFYLSIGASLIEDKQYFRMEGKDLKAFAVG